jgi:hypothetical protein
MIKCAHCKEQLSTYLDGIMTAEEKRLIKEHLSMCEHCSLALSELKKTQEALRNLEEVEPPLRFTQKIMNRVREEAEPRKGLLQRLFYPLHIKIPVEALATCLVVVLALFVYKNTEPEIKALHGPEEIVAVSPQNQPQKQYDKALSAPKEKEGKSDSTLRENHEQQSNTISPAHPESTGTGGLKKDTQPPATPSPGLQVAKKGLEETGNRYEKKTTEAETLKKQEPIVAQKSAAAPAARLKEESIPSPVGSVSQDTPKETKSRDALGFNAASVMEKKQLLFTVSTNTLETTVKETEDLLRRFNAKSIKRNTRKPRSVTLDADLPGQKVTEFYNALKTVGYVKNKDTPDNRQQEYVAVSIEITANP